MKIRLYFALLLLPLISNSQVYCDSVPIFNTLPDTVCFYGPFTLDASSNHYDTYLWQDGNTDSVYEVTSPGIYTCEVSENTGNIVVNGDFESGDVDFYTDYTPDPNDILNNASNGWVPGNGMLDEFLYAVGSDPHDYHTNWQSSTTWNPPGDHTSGHGNMLIVNGSPDTTANIWCQTIDVGANTDYVFSAWLTSIFSLSPATFVFTINGDTIGDIFTHSGVVGEWEEFFVNWHSDANQTIDICIRNQNSALNGNDFAIDDIFFGASCVQYDTVYVVAPPTSIINTNDVCLGDTATFINASTTSQGTITNSSWAFGDGYLSSETNPKHYYQNPGTYQVSLEVTNSFGCTASSTVPINIHTPPTSTVSTTDVLCHGGHSGTATVEASGGTAPYSYQWNNGYNTAQISNLAAGQYSVTINDANSCESTNLATISEPTPLTSSVITSNVSCYGMNDGMIDISVSGGTFPYSYLWNNSDTTQDRFNVGEGNYSVTITDANNCTITETASITQPPEIIITTNSNSLLCHGDTNGYIDISVSGGVQPYSYLWNTNESTEDLYGKAAGTYVVTVTDNSGCTKVSDITLEEPSQLFVSLPEDFTYCNQDTLLHASVEGGTPPYSYIWNNSSTSQDIYFSTYQTDTYEVTVTDNNGCKASNSTTVNIIDVQLDVYSNKDTVCPGDPILVTTNIEGGIPPYTIYNEGELTNFPVIVYPNGQKNYILKVVDACGNTDTARINVYTYPVEPISFNADILKGCPPLTVNFNMENYHDNFNYIWNFDDIDENNLSLEINPAHTFTESGLYDISVQVTDSNGCKNQLTINDMIEVYPKPEAHFTVENEVVSFINSNIHFDNISIDNIYNYWAFDDGDSSIEVNPIHNYENIGVFYPSLIVENNYGCLDTAVKKIEIKNEFTLYVPTAFSPDNDAINDGFRAEGHGIDLDNYWIGVYDRWGELIWESNDLYEYWNGTAKNGNKPVQIGVYKWLVVCKDFNGVEHTKSGNVTVIR